MKHKTKNPHLTLVGAGPGDPDLISVKGMKALVRADAVLYDALVHPDLLDHAPETAEKIFVGKRAGKKGITQQEINEMIVEYAFEYGHVVRLKGGDPFIFGRGQEEIEYATIFGIPSDVVPGISSATGLTGLKKIALTKRGVNESFWVVTGTTAGGKLSEDLHLAARSTATVVILMGANKLPEIVELYREQGRGNLPVAIIQNGSMPNEKVAYGSMDTIIDTAGRNGVSTPAIIVIGETVGLSREIPFNEKAIRQLNNLVYAKP